MRHPRASGILLHPTSLPGRFGIGDLGDGAVQFLDRLSETGQHWWQILPLGPTGYGNSPYQSYSSYAGNPLLISPERLAEERLLSPSDWADYPRLPDDRVAFDAVTAAKDRLLRRAFAKFRPEAEGFRAFVEAEAGWLDDYALFMALKDAHGGSPWYDWEPELVGREPEALSRARRELAETVRYYEFLQYVFSRQWGAVREACRARRVGLIGDLPIYVAQDCADVWSRPDLFWLDAQGRPTCVAGVPPDYFAATGQLWGNPLYRWEAHAAEGFAWWIDRLRAQLGRVDLVRLDHFRGFEAYWEVPAGSATAEGGRWVPGPGAAFLEAIRDGLGGLPIVAEDLGDITAEVLALRDRFELPGMRVLQFGFSGDPGTEFHLPFSYVNHCIAYTGTHDNETTVGWFTAAVHGSTDDRALVAAQRAYALRVLGSNGVAVHWDAIRAALASVADTVIVPLQDVLGLDDSTRMNVPGRPHGNWNWRLRAGQVGPDSLHRLADMTAVYSRWNGTPPARYGPPRRPASEIVETTPAPTSSAPVDRADGPPTRPKKKAKAGGKRRKR
jgi:4-alpha-glucanotransferase